MFLKIYRRYTLEDTLVMNNFPWFLINSWRRAVLRKRVRRRLQMRGLPNGVHRQRQDVQTEHDMRHESLLPRGDVHKRRLFALLPLWCLSARIRRQRDYLRWRWRGQCIPFEKINKITKKKKRRKKGREKIVSIGIIESYTNIQWENFKRISHVCRLVW